MTDTFLQCAEDSMCSWQSNRHREQLTDDLVLKFDGDVDGNDGDMMDYLKTCINKQPIDQLACGQGTCNIQHLLVTCWFLSVHNTGADE